MLMRLRVLVRRCILVAEMISCKTLPYRIYVIVMLGFAVYFANESVHSWGGSPIVVFLVSRFMLNSLNQTNKLA